jgi:CcmD family protein
MNATKFLYAAYSVTWIIHLLYIGSLLRRYAALRQRMKEVRK